MTAEHMTASGYETRMAQELADVISEEMADIFDHDGVRVQGNEVLATSHLGNTYRFEVSLDDMFAADRAAFAAAETDG